MLLDFEMQLVEIKCNESKVKGGIYQFEELLLGEWCLTYFYGRWL